MVIWTAIMRSLGYEGFTDKMAHGLIHSNEPCQAVFFSLKNIRLIEILHNVRRKKNMSGPTREFQKYDLTRLADLGGVFDSAASRQFTQADKGTIRKNALRILSDFGILIKIGNCRWASITDREKFNERLVDDLPLFLDKLIALSPRYFITFAKWLISDGRDYWTEKVCTNCLWALFFRCPDFYGDTPKTVDRQWLKLVSSQSALDMASCYPESKNVEGIAHQLRSSRNPLVREIGVKYAKASEEQSRVSQLPT